MSAALLACALNVAPATLEAIARVESGSRVLALNVNRLHGPQPQAANVADAVRITEGYIARGYSVDLGLMQVNSRNLPALGLTVEQVLEPCMNVSAGGRILTASYAEAARRMGEGQGALLCALSAYNTGNFQRGFANGYVAKYARVPAIEGGVRKAAVVIISARTRALTADIAVSFGELANGSIVQ